MNLLEVSDLTAGYGKVRALFGVSFTIAEGEFLALLGANGAGKTTTLQALSGLLPATGGIIYDGQPLGSVPAQSRVGMGMVHIPQ